MIRATFLACVAAATMILATQITAPATIAQEKEGVKKDVAKKGATKKASAFRRRLPNYFGQVGLSKEQKDGIYKIQETYHNQIAALQKQIADLEEKRDSESRGVLTEEQQKKLDELVATAKSRADARKKKKKTTK